MAMANSGMNPIIYAWKNRTFRRAFIHLLRCRTPDSHALIDDENARQNMKRKSSSLVPSLAPSLSAPPPTPNSIIMAGTPPAIMAPDSHHRSSLHRYHHGFTASTAFPLPPPPPSPQSPVQEPIEPVPAPPNVRCIFGKFSQKKKKTFFNAFVVCIDFNTLSTHTIPLDSSTEAHTDIENNNDEQSNCHLYLHPSANRWQSYNKNIIMDDDFLKIDFKGFNINNNGLYTRRLTTTSPAESIVSAPLTPTGNLIVNLLGNLDNNYQIETDIVNQKNYRNSTNCVIERNSNDATNTPILNRKKLPTIALAEQRQLNGLTKTIPITSKTSPNGTVQCVTIAINNNDNVDTIIQNNADHDQHSIKSNRLYCNRGYSLSNSAPQCINCWSGST